jgi:hypothetical protein
MLRLLQPAKCLDALTIDIRKALGKLAGLVAGSLHLIAQPREFLLIALRIGGGFLDQVIEPAEGRARLLDALSDGALRRHEGLKLLDRGLGLGGEVGDLVGRCGGGCRDLFERRNEQNRQSNLERPA